MDTILGPAVPDVLWAAVSRAIADAGRGAVTAGWGAVAVGFDAFATASNARAPRFWSRFA